MKNKYISGFLKIFFVIVVIFSFVGCESNDYSNFEITFIDVGQGDAALIQCDGHYMLIDAGPYAKENRVLQILDKKEVKKLDYVFFSHLDEDHIGGLTEDIINKIQIGKVYSNRDYKDTNAFRELSEQLLKNGKLIKIPTVDEEFNLGSSVVKVIALGEGKSENDSLILLLTYKNKTFLFTGDMTHDMEFELCEQYKDRFRVDLLKVSHHGSDGSSSYRFIRMLMPKYSIISVGEGNSYGHPNKEIIKRLKQARTKIYRTDKDGDIKVKLKGKKLKVDCEKFKE